MNWSEVVLRLLALTREGSGAAHKPLLLLWVLAVLRSSSAPKNAFPFLDVEAGLKDALLRYAPGSTALYPFWHLQRDRLWEVDDSDALARRVGKDRPTLTALRRANAVGRLPPPVWEALWAERGRLEEAEAWVLHTYWPDDNERGEVARLFGLDGVDAPRLPYSAEQLAALGNTAFEGSRSMRTHMKLERSGAIVVAAKRAWFKANPELPCECCRRSFVSTYGARGEGYIEAHHRNPLHTIVEGAVLTSTADLAAVCSDCHSMLHRRPFMKVEELRELVRPRVDAGT